MKTYSSKTIGNCLRTLAFAVVGALCALLVVGAYASFNWDITDADALTKGYVVLGGLISFILLCNAGRRVYRWARYMTLTGRRARS